MTDLDARLRALRVPEPLPPTPPSRLHARARRRRRRRTTLIAVLGPVLAAGVGFGVRRSAPEPSEQVSAGSTTTSPPTPATGTVAAGVRTIGDVTGVEVTVSPRYGLLDGDLVDVHIDGLDQLPDAVFAMCVGDVTADSSTTGCDFAAVDVPDAGAGVQAAAGEQQTVSVSRIIHLASETDPPETLEYDCAVEAAGCVLAIAPVALPVRAVLVPLTFRDTAAVPEVDASLSLTPPAGFTDGQEVTITAQGLRPNTVHSVVQCRAGDPVSCDVLDPLVGAASATSDRAGRATVTTQVWAAIYDRFDGLVDCTTEPCTLSVVHDETVAEAPLSFAPGVTAPTPQIRLEPAGPYQHLQEVTVVGTGFRPGVDLTARIGQCPNHLDTASEERCGYDIDTPTVVDADGTFTTTLVLYDNLLHTGSCRGDPGCHVGWVLPHGTTLAKAPLVFAP